MTFQYSPTFSSRRSALWPRRKFALESSRPSTRASKRRCFPGHFVNPLTPNELGDHHGWAVEAATVKFHRPQVVGCSMQPAS